MKNKMALDFGGFDDIAREVLKNHTQVTHAEAIELIRKKTRSHADLRSNVMIPPGFLRWSIMEAGFVDVGGKDPVYERVADV